MRGGWTAVAMMLCLLISGCLSGGNGDLGQGQDGHEAPTYAPRVIVGVPDSGINPYHEVFHRPGLTQPPCTYIQDFPCDLPALELSIGVYETYEEAYEADKHLWDAVEPGDWYWIPGTVFVAVHCERSYSSLIDEPGTCILDENGHGTGTVSSVLTENPDALIVFMEGIGTVVPMLEKGLPIDIYSHSWANIAPIPGHPGFLCVNHDKAPIFVTAAGNDPRSTLIDCTKGDPALISVGGAYAEGHGEEALAAKQPDVVSYYCRPTASINTVDEWRQSYCGTSFAAPTVAGALSKVVLAVRESTGYTGGLVNGTIDPHAGFTITDLREAMNRTASYTPEPQYDNTRFTGVPLNPAAPWLQWGWGFYDGLVANATIKHVLGIQEAPEKPLEARLYLEAVAEARIRAYGDPGLWPFPQDDAGSGRDAPDTPVPEVWIEPGIVYEGSRATAQESDFYAFKGEEGDTVKVKIRGIRLIVELTDDNGTALARSGSWAGWDLVFPDGDPIAFMEYPPIELTLEYTGIHYLHVGGDLVSVFPHQYAFSIGINEDAPEPGFQEHALPPLPPITQL
jgi:hypothetical protein